MPVNGIAVGLAVKNRGPAVELSTGVDFFNSRRARYLAKKQLRAAMLGIARPGVVAACTRGARWA